jgi:EpsI family protein
MSFKRTLTVSALMILTMIFMSRINKAQDVPLKQPFSTFPKQIGQWAGKEQRFDSEIYEILGVDDSFLADYRSPEGRLINLYIGFYKSQREGDIIHSPKNCMPGSGWNIVGSQTVNMEIPNTNPGNIEAVKLTLQKGAEKQIVFYWYQSGGRVITSEYLQKIYLVIDSITRSRTDGSFVRLIAPAENNDGKAAEENLKEFTKLLYPILNQYLPS